MTTCPACGRPAAAARPRCLYCGAPMPGGSAMDARRAPSPGPQPEAVPPASDRVLLVLDLEGAEPEAISRALGLSRFEAGQRVRRGGRQLHRVAEREAASAEAARLEAEGLRVIAVPEAEVRRASRPVLASGGRLAEGDLRLRTAEGEMNVGPADLFLVVRGPIVRERQIPRPRASRLFEQIPRQWDEHVREAGHRVHLHRRSEVRPLELDPDDFEFVGPPPHGGPFVQLMSWVDALSRGLAVDEGFKWVPPALAPSVPETSGALASAEALTGTTRREQRPGLLDNVQQFRFYSAWRACAERRR